MPNADHNDTSVKPHLYQFFQDLEITTDTYGTPSSAR